LVFWCRKGYKNQVRPKGDFPVQASWLGKDAFGQFFNPWVYLE
jgi:hypothetical protein